MRKITKIHILLFLSIFFNFFLIFKISSYILKNKDGVIHNVNYLSNVTEEKKYDSLIVEAGIQMMQSKKLIIPRTSYDELKLVFGFNDKKLKYNYHHAFLLDGLISYAITIRNDKIIQKVNSHLKSLIMATGNSSDLMNFSILDQVTFGLPALKMYKLTQDERYKTFVDSLYRYIKCKDGVNGILYRENNNSNITDPNQISDALAMTVPFLYNYGEQFCNDTAIYLANKQLTLFRNFAVDKETGMPTHGYNLSSKTKTGASNWGRGIGWYAIAMSCIENDTTKLTKLFINSLKKLELPNGGFSQFPGDPSKLDAVDASATIMILYFLTKKNIKTDYLKIFCPITTEDGWIDYSSGETGGLNKYSNLYGYSELTQGLMLKFIALKHKTNN